MGDSGYLKAVFLQLNADKFQNLSEIDAFLGKYINFKLAQKWMKQKIWIYDNHMRNEKYERSVPPNASGLACFIIELIPGVPYTW